MRIKYPLLIILLFAGICCFGKKHKRDRGLPRTEQGLMNNMLGCLSNKDSVNYFNLFPPFDTLWQLVMHHPDRSPEAQAQLARLKEHPRALLEFDPAYNPAIMGHFVSVLKKGEDSGIHWNEIVMERYELEQEVNTSSFYSGYEVIAPERFKGYIFVRDVLGRLTFCISVTEIQKISGYFFGGQVLNILEAYSKDQFVAKEAAEQEFYALEAANMLHDSLVEDSVRRGLLDSAALKSLITLKKSPAADPNDEDTFKKRREVVDRKFYQGKFDNEIPVKLYVRYMRDIRSNVVTGYDGLYKFGDQAKYVKLNITRSKEGVWTMDDDPPVGTMELELKNKEYTGSWTNNENQTGYDVVMKQRDISTLMLQKLDQMLESGNLGRVTDETAQPAKPAEPVIEGMENSTEDDPKPPPPPAENTGDDEPARQKKHHSDDE